MSRRRAFIPQRRAVFVGCEGMSEAHYAALLQDFVRDCDIPVHMVIHEFGRGAGDPFARVERAVGFLDRMRGKRDVPADRYLLLDQDQAHADPQRAEQARRLANDNGIVIVWQDTCFEAMLLRHLEGCATRRPPTTPLAGQQLRQMWEGYEKPMSRAKLAARIDITAVRRAAGVEAGLRGMLVCLGLIEPD